jgi:hypothetical protein
MTEQHAGLLVAHEATKARHLALRGELEDLYAHKSQIEVQLSAVLSEISASSTAPQLSIPSEAEFASVSAEISRLEAVFAEAVHAPPLAEMDAMKAELERERADLQSRTALMGAELKKLEQRQTRLCEAAMDQLAFAIEREERMLRLLAKRRELAELGAPLRSKSSLMAIPEESQAVTLDIEAADIESRQEELAALHMLLREANQVRQALTDRLAEIAKV